MAEEQVEITEQDIDSFKRKLDAWGDGLEPAEKALLTTLLGSASGGSEVEGYMIAGFGDAFGAFLSSTGGSTGGATQPKEVKTVKQAPDGAIWMKAG